MAKVQNNKQLPNGYTVGEEYFKDSQLISIKFELIFRTNAEIQAKKLFFDGREFNITNYGSHVVLTIYREVPDKLFSAWHSGETRSAQWVMGYVEQTMAPFNQELQKQRHNFSNPFIRNFSVFDILEIRIADCEHALSVKMPPPGPVPNFPFFEKQSIEFSEREYIKDFIDAYYAFFSYDFEASLRKIITSLECFFKYHHLQPSCKKTYGHLLYLYFAKET